MKNLYFMRHFLIKYPGTSCWSSMRNKTVSILCMQQIRNVTLEEKSNKYMKNRNRRLPYPNSTKIHQNLSGVTFALFSQRKNTTSLSSSNNNTLAYTNINFKFATAWRRLLPNKHKIKKQSSSFKTIKMHQEVLYTKQSYPKSTAKIYISSTIYILTKRAISVAINNKSARILTWSLNRK